MEIVQRKVTDGNIFQVPSKTFILICREFERVFKDYDLKKYYLQQHTAKIWCIEDCVITARELKKVHLFNKQFFKVTTQTNFIVNTNSVAANGLIGSEIN